jgi:hypothetical protein
LSERGPSSNRARDATVMAACFTELGKNNRNPSEIQKKRTFRSNNAGGSVRVEVYTICRHPDPGAGGGGSTGGQPQTRSGGRRDGERGEILEWTESAAKRIIALGFALNIVQ